MSRLLFLASCGVIVALAACQKSPTEEQADALSEGGRIRAAGSG